MYNKIYNKNNEDAIECERIGRTYFKNVAKKLFKNIDLEKDLKFSELITDDYDCYVTTDKKYIIEIKCRNIDSTRYDDFILDTAKHSFLMSEMVKGYTPLYVNFFTDGVFMVWDLSVKKSFREQITTSNRVHVNPNAGKKTLNRFFVNKADAKVIKNYDTNISNITEAKIVNQNDIF